MENVVRKTSLGLAVDCAVTELGLDEERPRIMGTLQRCFIERYEQFKATVSYSSAVLKGHYVVDNEFPIGEHDRQQYFRSIAFQAKVSGVPLTISAFPGQRKPFTLIEGYSRNDQSKKRLHSKTPAKAERKNTVSQTRKKQKNWLFKIYENPLKSAFFEFIRYLIVFGIISYY